MICAEYYITCDVCGCETNGLRMQVKATARAEARAAGNSYQRRKDVDGKMKDMCKDCADELCAVQG